MCDSKNEIYRGNLIDMLCEIESKFDRSELVDLGKVYI